MQGAQPQQPAPPGGGTGQATTMRPMLGAGAQAMSMVRVAIEALQKALQGLPMGSELHTAVLKSITDLSRRMEGGTDHAAQIQALAGLQRAAQGNPQAQAMQQQMMQHGGGAPGAAPQM